MAYLIALAALALVAIVATVWLIGTDGYGRVPTDPRRLPAGTDPAPSRSEDAARPTAAGAAHPADAPALRAPRDAARATSRSRRAQRDAARA